MPTLVRRQNKVELFLDSGAPSIYNAYVRKKKKASMGTHFEDRKHDDFSFYSTAEYKRYRRGYINFILENQQYLSIYINMDVINNPEMTYKNQKLMESFGLKPVPVYHAGCDVSWLKKYLDEGYDYIAIGGLTPNPLPQMIEIADKLWSDFLSFPNGMPRVKTHCFAMTSNEMLFRYPFFSVDSTSWVYYGRLGTVLIPRIADSKFIYNKAPLKIVMTRRAALTAKEEEHFDSLRTEFKRRHVMPYFESHGFTPEQLATDYLARDAINVVYFAELEKAIPEWPWPFKRAGGLAGRSIYGT